MPMDRSKYPPNWPEISKAIREREGGRCKWCKAENGRVVVRSLDGTRYLVIGEDSTFKVYDASDGKFLKEFFPDTCVDDYRQVGTKIVLTVAHLNAPGGPCQCDPRCGIPDHLAALCQRCHLNYDRDRHAHNRRENRRARLAARELF